MTLQQQRLIVHGIVQGVGFRPFVYRLAHQLSLNGWVRNDGHGVTLEVNGTQSALDELQCRLKSDAPPLAVIDRIDVTCLPGDGALVAAGFSILESAAGGAQAEIGADSAVCPACLTELFDPDNRRYRYAFINCTDCGPRYTLVHDLPYDRARTSMAGFAQCPDCLAEYTQPMHRRFHAEPNACVECGPQLSFIDTAGVVESGDPLALTLSRIRAGQIVAIKGLGGFHLVCDARNPAAVARLRERKQREAKPLALMVANSASLRDWVVLDEHAAALLSSTQRPIVLLRKTVTADSLFADLAPGIAWLGAMLPYTPLHYLLFHEAAGRPAGVAWLEQPQDLTLVMTSANLSGEPLLIDNALACTQLQGIADAFLLHNREIVTRCDDSVVRPTSSGRVQFIRRARGYTPRALPLATGGADVLALGGHFKNTLCLTRNHQAFVSQHIGNLDRVAVCLALESASLHLQRLLQIRPQALVHDLHPDFFSTRLAQQLAQRWQLPLIAVQHHHAHIAAVLAEHQIEQPVLGLALDGVGLGDDGQPWGGELLLVDGADYQRLGQLRPIGLPGGERAAQEPWRMGAAALALLGRSDEIAARYADQPGAAQLAQLLRGGVGTTSSMGRWFDAAAGLLGVAPRMQFEGQAAMQLEGLAERFGPLTLNQPLHHISQQQGRWQLDLALLLQKISEEPDTQRAAALFHAGLINALADWLELAAQQTGLRLVVCGGGCFLNSVLARGLRAALHMRGLQMLEAESVPPGDGGLSLGQAWVARHRLSRQ